jgi:hypothetical protein
MFSTFVRKSKETYSNVFDFCAKKQRNIQYDSHGSIPFPTKEGIEPHYQRLSTYTKILTLFQKKKSSQSQTLKLNCKNEK